MNNTLKILLILIGFIIGGFYQIYDTGKVYSTQSKQVKETILKDKELVNSIQKGDTNVNIWREINNINEILKEKDRISEIYTGTLNVIKEVKLLQKEQEGKITLLQSIIDSKNKEMIEKNSKVELYDKLIEEKQKEFEKETTLILNMDQFKKKTLYILDWNRDLRDIYYVQATKLKQFYSITNKNNKFINQLISLCDRTEYSLELKQIKCIVNSEDNVKSKLGYFGMLNLY